MLDTGSYISHTEKFLIIIGNVPFDDTLEVILATQPVTAVFVHIDDGAAIGVVTDYKVLEMLSYIFCKQRHTHRCNPGTVEFDKFG